MEESRGDVCQEEGNSQEHEEIPMERQERKNLRLLRTSLKQEEVVNIEERKNWNS